MTSPAPPYFSNWCTLWVVYLGLRALQLSLSVSSLCDLQHPTRGNKKDTVSSACDICLVHACFHRSLALSCKILIFHFLFYSFFFLFFFAAAAAAKNAFEWMDGFFDRFPSSQVIHVEKHGASNEGPYINLRPLLGVSLPYPLALPSPLSSGSVIDRLQQLRPPTALSSFGDTLSVLIRTLIGSPAPVEQD